MLSRNEATWDRAARVVLGLALIVAGVWWLSGTWGWVAIALGLILLVTGIVGFCPLYRLLGLCTHCPERAS